MLGTYYYHEIIRKTIIAFGTVFNGINIKHKEQDGSAFSDFKVPLSYGPAQKFLARLEQQANLNKPIQITLPRMSFEMNNIAYDSTRKAGITQTFKTSDGTNLKKVYMPVPYNIGFELNIFTKLNYDALDCNCCQGAFQRYFEYGIATGGFLEACIKNDLWSAMGRGDPDHISLIKNICSFIYNELPSVCTGVDGFDSWCYTGGASQDGRFSNIQPNN